METALDLLDSGKVRVAEKRDGGWVVNQWLKKAVLLSFRLNDMQVMPGPGGRRVVGQGAARSSRAGARTASAPPAFAPCPARSSGAPPISRRASC